LLTKIQETGTGSILFVELGAGPVANTRFGLFIKLLVPAWFAFLGHQSELAAV
jgi:hypothetical protein